MESGGTLNMAVIDNPDTTGEFINVLYKQKLAQATGSGEPPNFPNYRLGKWEGSVCDTIPMTASVFEVYSGELNIFPILQMILYELNTLE